MSNSVTTLDLISSSQAQKEVTSNALSDAFSPSAIFGRRASTTSALTWGYYGGTVDVAGTPTQIANGTLALPANLTSYIEFNKMSGAVTSNTTGWTGGEVVRLYSVVTGASTINSYTDYREAGLGSPTRQHLRESDIFSDFIVSGIVGTVVASLTMTLPTGVAYVLGLRTTPVAFAYTYMVSSDSYVDLSTTGVYTVSAVANGATAPAVAANSIRTQKVVTSATVITGVTTLIGLAPIANMGVVITSGYSVAMLPAGTIGMRAYVTDATSPTFLGALTGGGTVKSPVFYNGTAWVSA